MANTASPGRSMQGVRSCSKQGDWQPMLLKAKTLPTASNEPATRLRIAEVFMQPISGMGSLLLVSTLAGHGVALPGTGERRTRWHEDEREPDW